MFITTVAAMGALVGFSQPANAIDPEWTIKQEIVRIEYDANSNDLFFVGPSTWSSASCPNAPWVRILASLSGAKQILALGAAAQMAGKMVTFYGNCDSARPTYFNAVYIRVE